jgi:hypothetical protein
MSEMHVYTDDTSYVVAHDPEEAALTVDPDDGELFIAEFKLLPDGSKLSLLIEDVESDESETKTCREWADSCDEPTIIGSTEY